MALRDLADEDLMPLAAGGDARAFEVLYDRHSTAAYSLAYRIVGRRGLAEDVTQDAFLSVWRAGARYDRSRGSMRTWILGIVHNRAIDAVRRLSVHDRHRSDDELAADRLPGGDDPPVVVARGEESATVRAAMESLPPEQSRVIELAYFGGFTHTEIAELLGAPIGTVKGRMRLGLGRLRHSLAQGSLAR